MRAAIAKRAGKTYNRSDLGGTQMDHKTDAELREAERHWMARARKERDNMRHLESGRPKRQGRIWLK